MTTQTFLHELSHAPDGIRRLDFGSGTARQLTDETQQGQSGGNGVAPKQITFGYNPLGQFTSIARYNFVRTGPMVDIAAAAFSYDAPRNLKQRSGCARSSQLTHQSPPASIFNTFAISYG